MRALSALGIEAWSEDDAMTWWTSNRDSVEARRRVSEVAPFGTTVGVDLQGRA